MIFPPRSREGIKGRGEEETVTGNVQQLFDWIPACAGMTEYAVLASYRHAGLDPASRDKKEGQAVNVGHRFRRYTRSDHSCDVAHQGLPVPVFRRYTRSTRSCYVTLNFVLPARNPKTQTALF
jgi:hypothetical protein